MVGKSNKPNESKDVLMHSNMELREGTKCEAKDYLGNWYPARVIQVNMKEKTILIHFNKWNNRFDTWLPHNSTSIRQPKQPKSKTKEWRIGDRVVAKWGPAGKQYPATVSKIQDNKVEVTFYDGFKKTLHPRSLKADLEKLYRQYHSGSSWKRVDAQSTSLSTPQTLLERGKRRLSEPASMADYVTNTKKRNLRNSATTECKSSSAAERRAVNVKEDLEKESPSKCLATTSTVSVLHPGKSSVSIVKKSHGYLMFPLLSDDEDNSKKDQQQCVKNIEKATAAEQRRSCRDRKGKKFHDDFIVSGLKTEPSRDEPSRNKKSLTVDELKMDRKDAVCEIESKEVCLESRGGQQFLGRRSTRERKKKQFPDEDMEISKIEEKKNKPLVVVNTVPPKAIAAKIPRQLPTETRSGKSFEDKYKQFRQKWKAEKERRRKTMEVEDEKPPKTEDIKDDEAEFPKDKPKLVVENQNRPVEKCQPKIKHTQNKTTNRDDEPKYKEESSIHDVRKESVCGSDKKELVAFKEKKLARNRSRKRKMVVDGDYIPENTDISRTPNIKDTLSVASMVADERPSQKRRELTTTNHSGVATGAMYFTNVHRFGLQHRAVFPQVSPRQSFPTAAQLAASKIQRRAHQQKMSTLQNDVLKTSSEDADEDLIENIIVIQPSDDIQSPVVIPQALVKSPAEKCESVTLQSDAKDELDLTDIKLVQNKSVSKQHTKQKHSLDFITGRLTYKQRIKELQQTKSHENPSQPSVIQRFTNSHAAYINRLPISQSMPVNTSLIGGSFPFMPNQMLAGNLINNAGYPRNIQNIGLRISPRFVPPEFYRSKHQGNAMRFSITHDATCMCQHCIRGREILKSGAPKNLFQSPLVVPDSQNVNLVPLLPKPGPIELKPDKPVQPCTAQEKTVEAKSNLKPVALKTKRQPMTREQRNARKRLRRKEAKERALKLEAEGKTAVPVEDFKCTINGCNKSFRKLHLKEYHEKYFHVARAPSKQRTISGNKSPVTSCHKAKIEVVPATTEKKTAEECNEGSETESESEDELPSVDDCVKCACQDECELGFMIQCDQCMTWQHGECVGYAQPSSVPLFYLCHICSKPEGLRKSSLYDNDTTWHRHGCLPPVPPQSSGVSLVDPENKEVMRSIMLLMHSMVGELFTIRDVMQEMRNNFVHLQEPDDPRLLRWCDTEDIYRVTEQLKQITSKESDNDVTLSKNSMEDKTKTVTMETISLTKDTDRQLEKSKSPIEVKANCNKPPHDFKFGCHGIDGLFDRGLFLEGSDEKYLVARYRLMVEIENIEDRIEDKLTVMNKRLTDLEEEFADINLSKKILEELKASQRLTDFKSLLDYLHTQKWRSIVEADAIVT